MEDKESELFNYTTGRFLYVFYSHRISSKSNSKCDVLSANEALRLRERRRVFNIPGLFKIIADALFRSPEEIVGFRKLGEGGFNRSFLVTFDTGLRSSRASPIPS